MFDVNSLGGKLIDNQNLKKALESSGGSSGGASFPTITLKDEYNEETDQWDYSVTDYGEFENFDGLVNVSSTNVFVKFEGSDEKDLCSAKSGGGSVYLTTRPRCVFDGGVWYFNSDSYRIDSDGTVNIGSVSYTATRTSL